MATQQIITVSESQIQETPKAYGIKKDGKIVAWLPKSQVSKYLNIGYINTVDLIIPSWLFNKNLDLQRFQQKLTVNI